MLIVALCTVFGTVFQTTLAGQTAAGNQTADKTTIEPYVAVEEMPMYPGGNAAMVSYISKNIKYPVKAMESGVQGKVVVKFCVTAQGGVSMASVLKGVDPELDKEAVRVIQTINNFIPGKKDGVAVPVWYMVPITFTL